MCGVHGQIEQDAPHTKAWVFGVSLLVFLVVGVLMRSMPATLVAAGPTPLAQVNAILNAAAAVCLVVGFVKIKSGDQLGHKRWMIAAFSISAMFLVTYVLHHLQVGSVPFQGTGWLRTLYFCILIPHVILAAVVLPLAMLALTRGLQDKRVLHRRIAKYTLPIWFYVSASGVAVYFMLYHL
jgi:putative membrane protein